MLRQQPRQWQPCLRCDGRTGPRRNTVPIGTRAKEAAQGEDRYLAQRHAVALAMFMRLRERLSSCWVKVQLLKPGQMNRNLALKSSSSFL